MFTGLIQTTGRVQSLGSHELKVTWAIAPDDPIYTDLALGDSVAVDGVCLTVTERLPNGFIAAVSPETLSRTTLEHFHYERWVNLEGSLRVGSKLGGHFVTGHIDGVGQLQSVERTENAWEMSFAVSDVRVSRYIVPKGSIAVNGVSLTIAECSETGNWFKVAVIPVTYSETNLQYLSPGSRVNLEGDILGKYVEKFVRLGLPGASFETTSEFSSPNWAEGPINAGFLAEHGYL